MPREPGSGTRYPGPAWASYPHSLTASQFAHDEVMNVSIRALESATHHLAGMERLRAFGALAPHGTPCGLDKHPPGFSLDGRLRRLSSALT